MVELRLSAEERKRSILQAALPVFAEKGLVGATTKDIARAANVSEALLYRYFPSKEAMLEAIQELVCSSKDRAAAEMAEWTPATETLVRIVYTLTRMIAFPPSNEFTRSVSKLMMLSMTDDGSFVRDFYRTRMYPLVEPFAESVRLAREANDLIDQGFTADECLWFVHHAAVSMRLNGLTGFCVCPYGKEPLDALEDMIRFSLRGIGLKDGAINRYYNVRALNDHYVQTANPEQVRAS